MIIRSPMKRATGPRSSCLAGAGPGRRAGAEWVRALAEGPRGQDKRFARHIALVAESYADAREVMIEGQSGVLALSHPSHRPLWEPSRRRLEWETGAVAYCFSAEDPDGIRGFQFDAAWSDETGCAAIDKGANQPNVFLDAKSSESAVPYYSNGARDDLAQRRLIEAEAAYWRDPANNPVSSVYGGPMIDADRLYIWAWDARPFPFFPSRGDVWGDAANWARGHWLNGRVGRAPLDLLVARLAEGAGEVETAGLKGAVAGYALDRPLSPREAIDPLADIFQFDMAETAAGLSFRPRGAAPDIILSEGGLAAREGGAVSVTLAQASALPAAFRLGFLDEANDYRPAVAEARSPNAAHVREAGVEAPVVIGAGEAAARARAILADASVMAETAGFSLPPSLLALEPGDVIRLDTEDQARLWRLTELTDMGERRAEAARVAAAVYESPAGEAALPPAPLAPQFAPPVFALLDLPLLGGEQSPGSAFLAAFADPWPGAVALYRETAGEPLLAGIAPARAVIGRMADNLWTAPAGRFMDWSLRVALSYGSLVSVSEAEVLAGANILAVETGAGWEVLQFQNAELGGDGVWTISRLLRGQAGTEKAAMTGAGAGARCVLLTAALAEIPYALDLRGQAHQWRAGPERDHPLTDDFAGQTLTLSARALAPLSPVHLKARAEAGGVRLSWLRRTRIGGDGWEGEVPVGEAYERYRVRILDGETVLRTFDVHGPFPEEETPNALYTDGMTAADFPAGLAAHPAAAFEVAQLSDLAGEGERGRKGFAG